MDDDLCFGQSPKRRKPDKLSGASASGENPSKDPSSHKKAFNGWATAACTELQKLEKNALAVLNGIQKSSSVWVSKQVVKAIDKDLGKIKAKRDASVKLQALHASSTDEVFASKRFKDLQASTDTLISEQKDGSSNLSMAVAMKLQG